MKPLDSAQVVATDLSQPGATSVGSRLVRRPSTAFLLGAVLATASLAAPAAQAQLAAHGRLFVLQDGSLVPVSIGGNPWAVTGPLYVGVNASLSGGSEVDLFIEGNSQMDVTGSMVLGSGSNSEGFVHVLGDHDGWEPVGPGGLLTITEDLTVGQRGEGLLVVTGNGTTNVGGELVIGEVNHAASPVSRVDLRAGAQMTVGGGASVGVGHMGVLEVLLGSQFSASRLLVGGAGVPADRTSQVLVAGDATLSVGNGLITVGDGGKGRMSVFDGSVVSGRLLRVGESLATAQGTVVLQDGTVDLSQGAWIGRDGVGEMTVEAGGQLLVQSTLELGDHAGSSGRLVLEQGGLANIGGNTTVGGQGDAELLIQSGGQMVSGNQAIIGASLAPQTSRATVTGSDSSWGVLYTLRGAGSDTEIHVLDGGVLQSGRGVLGSGDMDQVLVTVSGEGSRWDVTGWDNHHGDGTVTHTDGDLLIGDGYDELLGQATLSVSDGGTVTVDHALKLMHGGTLSIDGGHVVTHSLSMEDGSSFQFEDGSLTIDGGSLDAASGLWAVGSTTGGLPQLILDNGAVGQMGGDAFSPTVHARESRAALVVQGGSQLFAGALTMGDGGLDAGSESFVTVTGAGSAATIDGPLVVAGARAHGHLLVEDGGALRTGSVALGTHLGQAEATATGTDTTWDVDGDMQIGGDIILGGDGSGNAAVTATDGLLLVADGAHIDISGHTQIGANGVLRIDGGHLTTHSLDNTIVTQTKQTDLPTGNLTNGTLALVDGSLTINGGAFAPGSSNWGWVLEGEDANGNPLLVLKNGTSRSSGKSQYVGQNFNGRLHILDGSSQTNHGAEIGQHAGSSGEVRVAGAGSSWTNNSVVWLGRYGQGLVEVLDGATASGWVDAGSARTGSGTLRVSGAGSHFAFTGNQDRFGDYGHGAFELTDGATAASGSLLTLANRSSSSATMLVSNNAAFESSASLYVGVDGQADARIESGGRVTLGNLWTISSSGDKTSQMVVHGAGSQITAINEYTDLWLGYGGTSKLGIEAGGQVTNLRTTQIGTGEGSVAEAWVDGPGSLLQTSNQLLVGYNASHGSLAITNGGQVIAGSYVHFAHGQNGSATLHISGQGSLLATDNTLVLGSGGQAEMTMQDGGQIRAKALSIGGTHTMLSSTTLHVTGAGTRMEAFGGGMRVAAGHDTDMHIGQGAVAEVTGNFALGWGSRTAYLTFGIGDDGNGNIAPGLVICDELDLIGTHTVFEIDLDPSTDALGGLALGDRFVLIDHQSWDGRLFDVADGQGGLMALEDGGFYQTEHYSFRIEYNAEIAQGDWAVVATVATVATVPEPALAGLGLLALPALVGRRRRVR